ncbi:hypothetical protein RDM67_04520, partial [Pseudomonas aeruginosa]
NLGRIDNVNASDIRIAAASQLNSLGYRQTFDFACLVAHCAALPRRINFAAFTVTPAAFSDCPPSLA